MELFCQKRRPPQNPHNPAVYEVATESEPDSDSEFLCDSIDHYSRVNDSQPCIIEIDQVFVTLHVGRKQLPVKFKIDTRSQANILSLQGFRTVCNASLSGKTPRKFLGYNNKSITSQGECNLDCTYQSDVTMSTRFHVFDTFCVPILGLRSCLDFQLIKIVMSVTAENSVHVNNEHV